MIYRPTIKQTPINKNPITHTTAVFLRPGQFRMEKYNAASTTKESTPDNTKYRNGILSIPTLFSIIF